MGWLNVTPCAHSTYDIVLIACPMYWKAGKDAVCERFQSSRMPPNGTAKSKEPLKSYAVRHHWYNKSRLRRT
jgi:hypothetical protein